MSNDSKINDSIVFFYFAEINQLGSIITKYEIYMSTGKSICNDNFILAFLVHYP